MECLGVYVIILFGSVDISPFNKPKSIALEKVSSEGSLVYMPTNNNNIHFSFSLTTYDLDAYHGFLRQIHLIKICQ